MKHGSYLMFQRDTLIFITLLGPFTHVVGFSQGGCMAALLAALCERDGEKAPLPGILVVCGANISLICSTLCRPQGCSHLLRICGAWPWICSCPSICREIAKNKDDSCSWNNGCYDDRMCIVVSNKGLLPFWFLEPIHWITSPSWRRFLRVYAWTWGNDMFVILMKLTYIYYVRCRISRQILNLWKK